MKSPLILSAAIAVLMSACANGPMSNNTAPFSQANLPDAVKVPAGHKVSMETVGVGRITYECREKAAMAGSYEWVFVGPVAVLNNLAGKMVGNYFAVAPATAGAIPLQLVKANPAMGSGAMTGTAYIQRVATVGGVAPNLPCDAGTKGKQEIVNYQADYIFWTAG